MKWTYDWLKEYLDTNLSAVEIADLLTRTGLEVEDLIAPCAPVAAKIVECKPHENSDHLHVLMVDDGTPELRQVVCGAPNARVGLVSALALPGCVIDGHEISSGKLRGVVSNGMMCSGKELGINDDHSGIIELDENTKPGTPVLDTKIVFDAGITPNRPDYLAVRGIARDLAACGAGEYIAPDVADLSPIKSARAVQIKTDKCPVYQFCEIHGIKIGDSHDMIKSRLAAIGINPKNAPIDATNYVCFDMGQPLHCFDADEIHGDIIVRVAMPGEEFTDLFGNTHILQDSDVVITDDMGILALAGVIGGARGMTTDNTKNIIIESAYFDPVSVRKTSKRLGISTDASYRYERGIDPTISGAAMASAANIIIAANGGEIVGTGVGGKIPSGVSDIEYTPELFTQKTGVEIPSDQQLQILEKLGFVVKKSRNKWLVTPRPARVNIEIPENIVAELVRIYGYDKIVASASHKPSDCAPHNDCFYSIKSALAARGLNECDAYGFGNKSVEELLSDKKIISVANPIVADMNTMRNNLLGNMLGFVGDNEKRGYPDVNLFMVGTVFDGDTPGAQHTQIAIVRTGRTGPKHWQNRTRDVDIYDVKADVMSIIGAARTTVSTDNPPRWAHPYRYGRIMIGNRVVGEFGQLHPAVARALKIKTNVCVGIIENTENIPNTRRTPRNPITDFQPIKRDFAFIVDVACPAQNIVSAARSADTRINDVVVFDAFDMGDNMRSIAFTITIIPTENMTDNDLMEIQTAVINNVEKKCDAKIRDK